MWRNRLMKRALEYLKEYWVLVTSAVSGVYVIIP